MNLRFAAGLVFVAALAGCAARGPAELPPATASPPPAAAPGAPPARVAPATAVAGAGESPSSEALAVLATIPEPVPGEPKGDKGSPSVPHSPAPRTLTPPPPAPPPVETAPIPAANAWASTPQEPRDSTTAAPDTGSVPVPSPTTPLGAESHSLPPTPELPAATPPPAPVAPEPVPVAPATAGPDTCWRVQLGAPSERARGRVLRDASQSLLMVPMTVERDAGRWKVRTRECLSRTAAESLRERALGSGFNGVFLVRFVDLR